MLSQSSLFSFLVVTAAEAALVKIAFNGQDTQLSPDVDGPWPTLPLNYIDTDSSNGTLDVYVTFSNASLLVKPQTCVHNITNGTFHCGEFAYPAFYHGNTMANPTMINFENGTVNFAPWNNITLTKHAGLDFSSFVALSGNTSGKTLKSDIGGVIVESPAIVAEDLTTTLSSSSRPIPLLNSMLSIPNHAAYIAQSGAAVSRFSSFHTGSADPFASGTLIIGGYDNNRILGGVMNWSTTYNWYGRAEGLLTIARVNIGVESGFLPLKRFKLINNSFPQGPYKQDPGYIHTGTGNVQEYEVLVEPGSPHLHLNAPLCDSLADVLELTYDGERNIYLWSYPPDHPIFRSPVYLELVISSDERVSSESSPTVSVKIPMALLQPTFHATTRAMNGTFIPPARYFPCSPLGFDSGIAASYPPRLGRAFLQAAFMASSFEYPDDNVTTAKFWLAQAPGPTAIEKHGEDLVEVESGYMSNRTNVIVDTNAWTNSWSGVLPIWTVDSDGVTTLDQLNAVSGTEDRVKELGVKVGVPVAGTLFAGVLLFFSVKGIKKSRATRKRIEREIAEEDATAREIERLMRSEKKL